MSGATRYRKQDPLYRRLASAWFYGDWQAETPNERDMQALMEQAGWWPWESEAELIAALDEPLARCETEYENDDGWTDWIHPLPGYLLQCCDCGLIHRMEFAIAQPTTEPPGLNDGETSDAIIVFRAARHGTPEEAA